MKIGSKQRDKGSLYKCIAFTKKNLKLRGNKQTSLPVRYRRDSFFKKTRRLKNVKKMSKDVKRGEVKMTADVDDDCDLPTLTAICFVGQKLRENSKLTVDAQTFGYKILFANDIEELLQSPEEIAYVLEEFEGKRVRDLVLKLKAHQNRLNKIRNY